MAQITVRLTKLPIGIQSFQVIRRGGYVYVDKTEHVYRLVDQGMFYFLARPRRFGKSLLVSTLRCLFEGKKDLFDGLWIANHADWTWDEHPVILLDFNQIAHATPENLRVGLDDALIESAQAYGITLERRLLKGCFTELVLKLYRKTNHPVVVLVDEYDKPIIDHLGQGKEALQIARANRDILKNFFGVLKGGDVAAVLRFVFITGVSRFSRVSIFSELNNLDDITPSDGYAGLLGYTQGELEHYFRAHIERFAEAWQVSSQAIVDRLQKHHDGYRFSQNPLQVYNPFSTLKAFREKKFGNYWFETGTPTFLVNLLKERDYSLPQIETLRAPEAIFGSYDIDDLQPEALLFQTGYITIRQVEGRLYHFGYPNQEVKTAWCRLREWRSKLKS
ncbi:MAG: AAA family ATPase [bacterium]|nr:AAA family ATPase [bacterium]